MPSPFAYKQDASSIQKSAAKFSFGSSKQRPLTSKAALAVPGPGTYPIKQIVGNETVGKSLGQKLNPAFQQPGANKTPGPGAYDGKYRTQKSSDPSWRIGTSRRDDQEKI